MSKYFNEGKENIQDSQSPTFYYDNYNNDWILKLLHQ